MSLINQMLRDLDARHAPALDRSALPGAVRVQQRPAARRRPLLGFALAVVAVGAVVLLVPWNEVLPPGVQTVSAQQRPISPLAQDSAASPQPAAETGMSRPPGSPPLSPGPGAAAVPKASPSVIPAVAARRKDGAASATAVLRMEKNLQAAPEKMAASAAVTHPPRNEALAVNPPPAGKDLPQETQASIDKRPRTPPGNESAENEFRKAMAALRRGAEAEAIDGLQAALRADARHHSARQAMLSLLVEKQQWREAQALLDEGLALEPAQTGWAMLLARLQFEAGKLGEAAETLARHAVHAEHDADFQAFDALLLQKLKRPGEATARYRKALGLKPTEARWWYGLGLALDADQKPQEARAAMLKARDAGNLPPELAAAVDQRLR